MLETKNREPTKAYSFPSVQFSQLTPFPRFPSLALGLVVCLKTCRWHEAAAWRVQAGCLQTDVDISLAQNPMEGQ